MVDRFYVGGDLGKRKIKTPHSVVEKLKTHSFSEIRMSCCEVSTDVVRVYNPKVEEVSVVFGEEQNTCNPVQKVLNRFQKRFNKQ